MMHLAMFVGVATATSFNPSPPTLTDQLRSAPVAGHFRVVSADLRILNDGFAVTDVTLQPLGEWRGDFDPNVPLVLPGAPSGSARATQALAPLAVTPGDELVLLLAPTVGTERPSYNFTFADSLYRPVSDARGPLTVVGAGRFVADVRCDEPAARAIAPPQDADRDADGHLAPLLPGVFYADDPRDVALPWPAVIAALARCGGAR